MSTFKNINVEEDVNIQGMGTYDSLCEYATTDKGSYIKFNNGVLIQWGVVTYVATTNTAQTQTISFPLSYTDITYRLTLTLSRNGTVATGIYECNAGGNVERQVWGTVTRINKTSANYSVDANWIAIGMWK